MGIFGYLSRSVGSVVRNWLLFGAVLVAMLASCSSKTYQIGDVGPAGGTVFIVPSTPGNTTGMYFEVAPWSEVELPWATGANQDLSVIGASGVAIGDGATNTDAIVRQAGSLSALFAAAYASEYSFNGFSDWFLPSRDELNEVYENRDRLGGFSPGFHWSSSEDDDNAAWGLNFSEGDWETGWKDYLDFVRPVRAFD